MAQVKTLVGEKLLIQISDGASPETFLEDCLINAARGIAFTSDVIDSLVPDCNDPSLPGWKEIFKDGMSATISGAGVLHTPSAKTWFDWMTTDTAKNVRVKIDRVGADGGGYISGAFKLVSYDMTGERKNNTTVDVSLQSHGALTWTANA